MLLAKTSTSFVSTSGDSRTDTNVSDGEAVIFNLFCNSRGAHKYIGKHTGQKKHKKNKHILFYKHSRYLPAPQHISLRIICKSALTELDSMIYFLKLINAW